MLARWRKSIIGGTATADITINRITGTGTVGTTIDRIMAMGTVGITIVGGNRASALAAPSGSKKM